LKGTDLSTGFAAVKKLPKHERDLLGMELRLWEGVNLDGFLLLLKGLDRLWNVARPGIYADNAMSLRSSLLETIGIEEI